MGRRLLHRDLLITRSRHVLLHRKRFGLVGGERGLAGGGIGHDGHRRRVLAAQRGQHRADRSVVGVEAQRALREALGVVVAAKLEGDLRGATVERAGVAPRGLRVVRVREERVEQRRAVPRGLVDPRLRAPRLGAGGVQRAHPLPRVERGVVVADALQLRGELAPRRRALLALRGVGARAQRRGHPRGVTRAASGLHQRVPELVARGRAQRLVEAPQQRLGREVRAGDLQPPRPGLSSRLPRRRRPRAHRTQVRELGPALQPREAALHALPGFVLVRGLFGVGEGRAPGREGVFRGVEAALRELRDLAPPAHPRRRVGDVARGRRAQSVAELFERAAHPQVALDLGQRLGVRRGVVEHPPEALHHPRAVAEGARHRGPPAQQDQALATLRGCRDRREQPREVPVPPGALVDPHELPRGVGVFDGGGREHGDGVVDAARGDVRVRELAAHLRRRGALGVRREEANAQGHLLGVLQRRRERDLQRRLFAGPEGERGLREVLPAAGGALPRDGREVA